MNEMSQSRLSLYSELIRLNRPIGILLLLWPGLWALWIAGEGEPTWWIVLVFIAGTALMRSAGCAINDYADRDLDGHVQRTIARPIASGRVSPREALAVAAILALLAFMLVLLLNYNTILMSFVAVALAAIYPFMKRYTHMPQLVLGMAFGWAIPMAFTALTNQVPAVAWVLFVATVVWALIYDTMYAMVDRIDDLKVGIKSTAILFGSYDRLIIGLLQLLMLGLLLWAGSLVGRGGWYWLGVGMAALLFLYQQWLIRKREPDACFKAFLNNNYVGMVVFAGLFLDYF
ncbi:MAG: 4-hydroxybenzoate octaprenyltransferase [Pseudomonadota bacterium]|nr:4-hydroxybenzoate octaprenyltransferase [Pseudomonadota bacterium]